jgi:hypothetical protein
VTVTPIVAEPRYCVKHYGNYDSLLKRRWPITIRAWLEPELFLQHGSVKVFHAYDQPDISLTPDTHMRDLYDMLRSNRRYCVNQIYEFDIDQLPHGESDTHEEIIRAALDTGIIDHDVPF